MQTGKKETMILKKDIWIDEAGKVGEGNNGLPKGWAKGKLVARAGEEISDLQADLRRSQQRNLLLAEEGCCLGAKGENIRWETCHAFWLVLNGSLSC